MVDLHGEQRCCNFNNEFFIQIGEVMFLTLFLLLSLTTQLFTQSSMVVPYISSENIGMQINPIVGGVKSAIPNQETELNIALFYADSSLLQDDQIVGVLEGRLISEMPLSSFDLLKQLAEDNSIALSNYGEKFKNYKDALQKFKTFQQQYLSNYAYDDQYYYYYEETNNQNNVNNTNTQSITNIQESISNTNIQSKLMQLDKIEQMFVAQSIEQSSVMTNSTPSISETELQQLIYIERLKQQYQSVVSQYNALVEAETSLENKYIFDPADPTEEFSVAFFGGNVSGAWSKTFRLDGVKKYQSYNSKVWYLGYQIPITKKDLKFLYALFTKNTNIRYLVNGKGGSAEFILSSYFVDGAKELFQLYGQGKLIRDTETKLPLLRD